ncbi:MAG: universal stress protein [Coriobacteriia bacterium]|nr:universal stress protein [Coriobacteriia bacterium]
MIRTVLIPADFTPECELVVRFAAGLARSGVTRAIVAHVVDGSGSDGSAIAGTVDAARDRMGVLVAPLREAGIDAEVRIPTGEPEAELLALATEACVDAIVIGTRGGSASDTFFAGGSVSERVALGARVPVLLARYDLLRTQEDPGRLAREFAHKLLVPTDFSATAQRAFDVATALPASAIGALRVMYVLPDETGERAERTESGAEFQLRNLVAVAKESGIAAQATIGRGAPERAILAEIDERRITGVVVGTRGRGLLAPGVIGSVSMTLVRQASCPVMIVS